MTQENYKGFDLFNFIEDVALRNRNRAVVLANMAEDNMQGDKLSHKGMSMILGYFQLVPEEDRAYVKAGFVKQMAERGYGIS